MFIQQSAQVGCSSIVLVDFRFITHLKVYSLALAITLITETGAACETLPDVIKLQSCDQLFLFMNVHLCLGFDGVLPVGE